MTNHQLALLMAIAAAFINIIIYSNPVAAIIVVAPVTYVACRLFFWAVDKLP